MPSRMKVLQPVDQKAQWQLRSRTWTYSESQTSWAHLLLPVPALAQHPGRAIPPCYASAMWLGLTSKMFLWETRGWGSSLPHSLEALLWLLQGHAWPLLPRLAGPTDSGLVSIAASGSLSPSYWGRGLFLAPHLLADFPVASVACVPVS